MATGLPRKNRPDYTERTEKTIAEIWIDSPDDTAIRVVIHTVSIELSETSVASIRLTSAAAREMARTLSAFAAESERIERARPLNGQLSIF